MGTTSFEKDVKTGNKGEKIFYEYMIKRYDPTTIINTTSIPKFQKEDIDYVLYKDEEDYKTFEIKANYKDNDMLFIEEFTNYNESLGPISYGWVVKTKADYVVFVSISTSTMIFMKWKGFKKRYLEIGKKYNLIKNQNSIYASGNIRQGAYKIIPLYEFEGLYKKIIQ